MSLETYWPDLVWTEPEGSKKVSELVVLSELLYIFIISINITTWINTI
jgi:hypothetical protein